MNDSERTLFQLEVPKDPSAESWPQVVARRMQSLVMGFPIHQMASKGGSGYYPEWQGQNFTFLALQVFDSIFARMAPGMGRGATREEIIHDLTPFILERRPDLTEPQVEGIVDFAINNLMNEGRGNFEQECVWLNVDNSTKPYTFRYGLLMSYHDPETDQFIIRATREAIHLYLRMLDQPVEDEQISSLFILYDQIRSGRIGHSRREAERTMLLSLEYERYIDDMLRAIRRDVRGVDWVREVTPRIEEAHTHVQRLIREQGRLLKELKKELQGQEDQSLLREIHNLIDILELCQRRHMELQKRILGAGPAFLEEQAYQRFRNMARNPMPDLNEQVFLPALTIEGPFLKPALPNLFRTVLGPKIHRMMDLELLVDRLLRDELPPPPAPDDEDLENRIPVLDQYNPVADQTEEKISDLLLTINTEPLRLSSILARGRAQGLNLNELATVGITLLHSYHARSDLLELRVRRDGVELEDPDFMGDDLLICRELEEEL